jgi:hypothetical protein
MPPLTASLPPDHVVTWSPDQRIAGEAEDPLGDLVALDLRGAAGDGQGPVVEHEERRQGAVAFEERGIRSG